MTAEQVNWVEGKADCNVADNLLALYHQAGKDVEDANKLSDKIRGELTFKVGKFDAVVMRFTVMRMFADSPAGQAINFCVGSDEIIINRLKDHKYGGEFIVKCKWNETKGECELLIDDQTYELWQISQKALSPLFFSKENIGM